MGRDYGQWGTPEERIVHKDDDFVIVRHPAQKGGFVFEAIPITEKGSRLYDWEICPELDTLEKAKKLMEKHRKEVRDYKRKRGIHLHR